MGEAHIPFETHRKNSAAPEAPTAGRNKQRISMAVSFFARLQDFKTSRLGSISDALQIVVLHTEKFHCVIKRLVAMVLFLLKDNFLSSC
jgi:hypothetical protein